MNTSINEIDLTSNELQAIIEIAHQERSLYVKEALSGAYKKLINLLSTELPKSTTSAQAHS